MKLSKEDSDRFFRLFLLLLFYANRRIQVVEEDDPAKIGRHGTDNTIALRNYVYDHPEVIDQFATENPLRLPESDLETVRGWKHVVRGRFYALRQLKTYAVLLSDDKPMRAYGVLALNDTLEAMVGRPMPFALQTALLPFDGRIICDGLVAPYSVAFSSRIAASLAAAYEEAKAREGVITSLPFVPSDAPQPNADLLRFYLKNEANREEYSDRIWSLMDEDPSLRPIYHQEMGRFHARTYRRRFKEAELLGAWFAILDGLIIASGASEREATEMARRVVPEGRHDHIFVFRYQPK